MVELHWHVRWYESRFAPAALPCSRLVDGVRHLEPIDQLAALLLFYARDGFARLRLAADIGAWWDRRGGAATPVALEHLAQTHPELAEAWRAALTAVAPVVGLPADATPSALRPRSRRGLVARRLGNWDLRGDTDQIKANVTLVDGLLAPRDGLGAFARRHVLVPAAYLIEVYGIAPDASVRAWSWRAWHAAKTGARY